MAPPRRIWVDTDMALGTPGGDVDDGFALAAVVRAAQAEDAEVEILGLSAVTGNTDGASAVRAARDLLRALDAPAMPCVAEADAPRALAVLPEGACLLLLGPPGNLVAAARLDPTLPARIDVHAVGTVRDRLRHPVLPWIDLNFRTDPAATAAFRRLRFRSLVLHPLDVVAGLRFQRRDLARAATTGEAGRYLARESERWRRRSRWRNLGRGFPVWDLVAALAAIGRLPGAVYSPSLESFDVEGARESFFVLLECRG